MEIIAALKVLKKLSKLGDNDKIKATLDGEALEKSDIDFHFASYVLEAWRKNPQEYYRCEFSYFHPKNPEVKVNGKERYQETADADLHLKEVTLEIKFVDTPDSSQEHSLKFVYPFV